MLNKRSFRLASRLSLLLLLSFSSLAFSWPFFNSSAQPTKTAPLDWRELSFYTEEYPPYNYTDNGTIKGASVEILIRAAELLDADVSDKIIQIRPWSRAYNKVLRTPNSVLFSTARTPAREKLFKWAGPIYSTRTVLLAREDRNIVIESPADLNRYAIGVMIDDVGEHLALASGAQQDALIYAYSSSSLAKMLVFNRIDLWAYEEKVALWTIKNEGFNPELFEVVHVLDDVDMYYAFNIETDDIYVEALQSGIDRLRDHQHGQTNLFQQILKEHKNLTHSLELAD